MSVQLGLLTGDLRLHLVEGSALPPTSLVLRDGETWPGGTSAKFVFADGVEWAAVVSGSDLTWSQSASATASRTDGMTVRLVIDDTVYLTGEVVKPRG